MKSAPRIFAGLCLAAIAACAGTPPAQPEPSRGGGGVALQPVADAAAAPTWRYQKRLDDAVAFVLKTQNADGTWAPPSNWDQKRSPGIINFLVWYYQHVEPDPRIPRATQKFEAFILDPENGRKFGMVNVGAAADPKDRSAVNAFDCVTGLTGRALADILQPGVDAQW